MNRLMLLIVPVFFLFGLARADVYKVRHDHDPWGSCHGELVIDEEGIRYQTDHQKDERNWSWSDIETFDLHTSTRFTVLTYENRRVLLGRDRRFDFTSQQPLTATSLNLIRGHLQTPFVDHLPRDVKPVYKLPVRHLHHFGGCDGILIFSRQWVVYKTDYGKDARSWRRDRDIAGYWSLNRYELEIAVYEGQPGSVDNQRRFRFQLKEPLDESFYRKLRRQLLSER